MYLPVDGPIIFDLVNIAVYNKKRSIPLDSCELLLRCPMKTSAQGWRISARCRPTLLLPPRGKMKVKEKQFGENDTRQTVRYFDFQTLCVLALFHFMNAEQLKMLLTVSKNGAAKIFGLPPVVKQYTIQFGKFGCGKRNHLRASQIISVVTSLAVVFSLYAPTYL